MHFNEAMWRYQGYMGFGKYEQMLPGYDSAISDDEFKKLQELAIGKQVLEIGSFKGYSAYRMAFSAARIDCVDPFVECDPSEFIKNTSMYDSIFLHIGRSDDVVKLFLPVFDMVFIDGDHTYDGVLNDLRLAHDKVKVGGTIAIHDYWLPEDFLKENPTVEVKRAVDDWLGEIYYMPLRDPHETAAYNILLQQAKEKGEALPEPPPVYWTRNVPELPKVDSLTWYTQNVR